MARSCWATLRPDTEATTAISAVHMAMRMLPLAAGVGDDLTDLEWRGAAGVHGGSVRLRSSRFQYETVSYCFMSSAVTRSSVRHPSPVPCATVDPRVSRTRAAVLRTATDLLVEGGPYAVTIDAIVARSGVAKSTIYRHWQSRDEVLLAVIESCAPQLPEPDPDADVVDALREVVHAIVGALNDPEWARVLPALLMLKNHEAGIKAIDERLEHEQDMVVTMLHRAGRQGGRAGGRHRRRTRRSRTCSARCCSPTSPRACRSTTAFADRTLDRFLARLPPA